MTANWKSESQCYEDIGRFCVEFELVCHNMEVCIRSILIMKGLKDPGVQEVLLSGYTAEPLRALLQKLLGEILVTNDHERSLCSKALSIIQDLINQRNDLLHSKWYLIGFENSTQEAEIMALGHKLHSSKEGSATKNLNINKSKLQEHLGLCREAYIIISLISRCIFGYRTLSECFEIKSKKLKINHNALMPVEINV